MSSSRGHSRLEPDKYGLASISAFSARDKQEPQIKFFIRTEPEFCWSQSSRQPKLAAPYVALRTREQISTEACFLQGLF